MNIQRYTIYSVKTVNNKFLPVRAQQAFYVMDADERERELVLLQAQDKAQALSNDTGQPFAIWLETLPAELGAKPFDEQEITVVQPLPTADLAALLSVQDSVFLDDRLHEYAREGQDQRNSPEVRAFYGALANLVFEEIKRRNAQYLQTHKDT